MGTIQTYQNISDCMCACACTVLLQLRASIAPLHGRFWPSGLHSPNGNGQENIFAAGAAALRAFPRFKKSRRSLRRGTASHKPATGAAHGVQARRRRRSWYRRCMSDRAVRQHRAGSAPSSCTGRELSARAGNSEKAGRCGALRPAGGSTGHEHEM